MKKAFLRLSALVLSAALAVFSSGCQIKDYVEAILIPVDKDSIYYSSEYSEISDGTLINIGSFDPCGISEINNYKDEYSEYGSSMFKSSLSGGMLTIYNALGRAYSICANTLLLPAEKFNKEDILTALKFLSCDSPFVSGNQSVFVSQVELKGVAFSLVNIGYAVEDKKQKRDIALQKAKQIVADIPGSLSEIEKAWYLYKYVVTNILYDSDENYIAGADFLYDALITGKTNCDGFSEALSLLFNLAGLETVSPFDTPEAYVKYFLKKHNIELSEMMDENGSMKEEYAFGTGGEAAAAFFEQKGILEQAKTYFNTDAGERLRWINAGHVLNIARIDGKHYLFDATWEQAAYDYIKNTLTPSAGCTPFYFAMSTVSQPIYNDLFGDEIKPVIPVCDSIEYTGYYSDLKLDSITQSGTAGKIAGHIDTLSKSGKNYSIIYISQDFSENDCEKLFNKVINQTARVSKLNFTVINEHYLYIIF